jgi:hypothetical protein
MHIIKHQFGVFNAGKTVLQVGLAGAQGFHLGPEQGDTGFEGLQNMIFMPGFSVLGDSLDIHAGSPEK